MSDAGGGGFGNGGFGISDSEAAAFAESQGAIGLGTLGLTASELADVSAQGVGAAYGYGQTADQPDLSQQTPEKGTTFLTGGGPSGDVGGTGAENIPQPHAWEANIEKAGEKAEQKAAITRKRRRRTLLTPEEGGIMQPAPVYRRSILGR